MPKPPKQKRTTAFIDGQNLYYATREAFSYTQPNYNPLALATAIAKQQGWRLTSTRFYTGLPNPQASPFWHHFWVAKLRALSWQGVTIYSRPLRYRNHTVALPNGRTHTFLAAEEKGVDVRIALDIIRGAHRNEYDVALIFSQDQDLSEVADEIRTLAQEQQRCIKMASAFPRSPASHNRRGITNTDWLPIDRTLYDACLDPRDYRPKSSRRP